MTHATQGGPRKRHRLHIRPVTIELQDPGARPPPNLWGIFHESELRMVVQTRKEARAWRDKIERALKT